MLSFSETKQGLSAAIRLFSGEAAALHGFDRSATGFVRSFYALLLLVPFAWVDLLAERNLLIELGRSTVESFPQGVFVAVRLLGLCVIWFGFAALMLPITRSLNVAGAYSTYIIAHNWASVVAAGLNFLPSFALAFHLLPPEPVQLLSLLLLLVTLRFLWLTARLSLGVNAALAAALVVVELVLVYVVSSVGDRLIGLS